MNHVSVNDTASTCHRISSRRIMAELKVLRDLSFLAKSQPTYFFGEKTTPPQSLYNPFFEATVPHPVAQKTIG